MLTEYTRWVNFSSQGPHQLDERRFEFRYNNQPDVVEWIQTTPHACEIRINTGGYLAVVAFDRKDGAMEFKLRWC